MTTRNGFYATLTDSTGTLTDSTEITDFNVHQVIALESSNC